MRGQTNFQNLTVMDERQQQAESVSKQGDQDRIERIHQEFKIALRRGDHERAESIYRELLNEQPDNLAALLDLGALYMKLGRISEAIHCNRQMLEIDPENDGALNNLAGALLAVGKSSESIALYRKLFRLVKKPFAFKVASNYLMTLQYDQDWNPESGRAASLELGAQFGNDRSWTAMGKPKDKIRIGFVSADLYAHPVGFLLRPVIKHLDAEAFSLYFYAHRVNVDWVSMGFQKRGVWTDISRLGDEELAALIREHEIDILIDLSGHTAHNRLTMFANRAAPCQISWLGYFATTGIPAMDYVLMDRWHVPDEGVKQFTETVFRLPHSRFCFEPVPYAPDVAPSPHLANGYVTFGSFNNPAKYNPQLLAAWADILAEIPDSRLILKYRTFADPEFCAELRQRFSERGIDPARIEFRETSPYVDVLKAYADVDVALDTFPFSGGYTTLDALWMGVPVVTCPGERTVSRQTYCMLATIGRQDWVEAQVAGSVDEYVAKAVFLARDSAMLQRIRQEIRPVMQASPLMDAPGFAKALGETMKFLLKRARK